MAKKSKQNNLVKLVVSIVVIAFAVLTLCTLFFNVFSNSLVATGVNVWTATGSDVLSATFASEASSEMSAGTLALFALKKAEDTSFVTTVFMWGYILTLVVSVATIVLAILSLLGMKLKLVNIIVGSALIVLALVTFIMAIVLASKNTAVTTVLGKETGFRTVITFGTYVLFAGIISGGADVYNAVSK